MQRIDIVFFAILRKKSPKKANFAGFYVGSCTKGMKNRIVKKRNFFGKNTQDKRQYILYNGFAKSKGMVGFAKK